MIKSITLSLILDSNIYYYYSHHFQYYRDRNNLTGDIPDEMFNLKNLLLLDLDNNKLSGPISNRFGELQELRFLTIGNNNFDQQALPDGISNLDKLGKT